MLFGKFSSIAKYSPKFKNFTFSALLKKVYVYGTQCYVIEYVMERVGYMFMERSYTASRR